MTAHLRPIVVLGLLLLPMSTIAGATVPRYEVVHRFTGMKASTPGRLIQASDGLIYGTLRSGGFYRMTLDGVVTVFQDVGYDRALIQGLIQGLDGAFYGTSYRTNGQDIGSVYRITSAGEFTVLHDFTAWGGSGWADGRNPRSALIQGPDGMLYGTTQNGGASDAGTVFQITPGGS